MNIKVILISSVNNLGVSGNIVYVKPGYARNFLIPKEKAVIATKENLLILDRKKIKLKKLLEQQIQEAKNRVKQLNSIKIIEIYSQSGEEGKLFGSINRKSIAEAISRLGFPVNKNEIKLLNGPLRTLGKHQLMFRPHNEVNTKFVVTVISES